MSGWLEGVLKDGTHPARAALVWQNLYFGASRRNRVKLQGYIEAGNSPRYLHPELLDEVLKYVYMLQKIAEAWRQNSPSACGRPVLQADG